MAKITVKPGQSWSAVAKAEGVSEDVLKRANPGVKTLKTGQKINNPFTGNAIQSGQRIANEATLRRIERATAPPPPPPLFQQGQPGIRKRDDKGGNVRPSLTPVQANPFAGSQGVYGGTNLQGPTFVTGSQRQTFVTPSGETVRVAPNSAYTVNPSQPSAFQNFLNVMSGANPNAGQAQTAVSNRSGYSGQGAVSVTNNAGKGGNVRPMLAPVQSNPFAGTSVFGGQINTEQQRVAQENLRRYGFQTPPMTGTPQTQPYTGTAGYTGQFGQYGGFQTPPMTGTAPRPATYGAASYMNPAYQQQGQQTQAQSPLPPRPEGTYTGDPNDPNTQKWRDYWNASARLAANDPAAYQQAIGGPTPPRVMTIDEIRAMKKAQRERQGYYDQQQTQSTSTRRNSELRRNIVWGT